MRRRLLLSDNYEHEHFYAKRKARQVRPEVLHFLSDWLGKQVGVRRRMCLSLCIRHFVLTLPTSCIFNWHAVGVGVCVAAVVVVMCSTQAAGKNDLWDTSA